MKIFKRILKYLLLLILIVFLTGFIFTFFFGEKVERIILERINSKLKTGIEISDIEFSLYKNFPYASVQLNDVLILESFENSNDTLLFAKQAFVKLNILDIISQKYNVRSIIFESGNINVKYDKDGIGNFNIFRDSTKSKNKLEINRIEIKNSDFTYNNSKTDFSSNNKLSDIEINLTINEDNTEVNIGGDLFSQELINKKHNYLDQKQLNIHVHFQIQNNSLHGNANIIIEDVEFSISEMNYTENEYDLKIIAENQELSSIIKILPERFEETILNFELAGNFNFESKIIKEKQNINPSINLSYTLKNGEFNHLSAPFNLKNANCNGQITNGNDNNFEDSRFTILNLKSKKKDGFFNGNFIVTNFNNYQLEANLNSSWEVSELNDLMSDSPFNNLKGRVNGNLIYNGELSFDKKMKEYFVNSTYSSDLILENIEFKYKESPLLFSVGDANCKFENNNIIVANSSNKISDSDLFFKGEIKNLIPYLFELENAIDIRGTLSSDFINFEELFTIKDLNGSNNSIQSGTVLPNWISTNINFNIANFNYDNFNSTDFKGIINYNNKKLKLKGSKFVMNTLDGKASGEFTYSENKIHDLVLKSKFNLEKINIKASFKSFNNFGQTFIADKNINGIGTATINIRSMWDNDYNFYSKSLQMTSQIKIENGELNDFEPLYNLSDYVSLEELKDVKFATLENTIRIKNENIIIPEMEIKSTALTVHVSGTHSFENYMDYKIELLLSDILSKKLKKNNSNKNLDLSNLEHDHSGKTTVHLKMKGDVDDPKISFNSLQLKEDIIKEIKNETLEIIDIIGDGILNPNQENATDSTQISDIEIKWEDDDDYKKN
ncbi:MAG: hypothetical protein HN427_04705 [Flavobacteriales bacterium]|nr:hypothetical protein [Flavobacteriales bacterium]MBT7481793.1 hypothetical protein [Flavobacteriales bacterium]